MNDADIEMGNLEAIADREDDLKDQGICCHGFRRTAPGNGRTDGKTVCIECGKVAEWEILQRERSKRLRGIIS